MKRKVLRVLSNDQEIGVFFRGSYDTSDWATNFKIYPKRIPLNDEKIYAHAGFLDVLLQEGGSKEGSLLHQLELVLNDLGAGHKKIVFSGHSLGGALAMISAAILYAKYGDNISAVITFGQPAVGFRGFRDWYPLIDKTTRINSGFDIVTFLPGPFYKHVGEQYWIHNDEVFKDIHWLRRIFRLLKHAITVFHLDHKMTKYIRHKTLILKSNLLKKQ